MGECLISRRGGELYELPVLDGNYPADTSVMESASGKATFSVVVATPGRPAVYSYQWYVNGSQVSGATASTYEKTGLTAAATYNVYCEVTNKAGKVTSRVAKLTVASSKPVYTFSVDNAVQLEEEETKYNWKMKIKSSGTLKFTSLGCFANGIDVFCVGGGGSGAHAINMSEGTNRATGGGAGGKTTTKKNVVVAINTPYTITVGAGGTGVARLSAGNAGGETSAFDVKAAGGTGGTTTGAGGSGGSGGGGGGEEVEGTTKAGGKGGSDGSAGGAGYRGAGSGQTDTTKEFGETTGTLYAGGGGGGGYNSSNAGSGGSGGGGAGGAYQSVGTPGTTNFGGGGGGTGRSTTSGTSAAGGSGVVVIRNKR